MFRRIWEISVCSKRMHRCGKNRKMEKEISRGQLAHWSSSGKWPCVLLKNHDFIVRLTALSFGANLIGYFISTVWIYDYLNLSKDLPMWPSGQSTLLPCAVEHDALSGRGSCLSLGASAYQRIICNNSYAHDEQGVNPGQVRGSTVSAVYCDRCWCLD